MEILVLSVLILLNGFFALSEIALVSSKRSRLERKKNNGSKNAVVALKLLDNSENFLSAIQVGITLIGIITGVYGGVSIADDLAPVFQNLHVSVQAANQIALVVTVVIITYFSIVIGELVPKTIALNNPEKIALRVAPVIYFFSSAFYPLVKVLSVSTNLVNQLLGIQKMADQITETELKHMIKTASVEGVIEKEQNILHEKVFYFADKKAKHIMTHRTDVEWVDLDKGVEHIKKTILNSQHSKLLCCNGSLENFKGIIHVRDFYKSLLNNNAPTITESIIEPMIVPENMDAQKVLNMLRHKNKHMCVVVNEYGGFEGIITIHDIVENIVGQIPEEGEVYEPDVFVRDDHSVLINGDAPIETLSEVMVHFNVDFDHINYSTVAGFVFSQLGTIPQIGDKFEYHNFKIEIVDMDGAKIDKILITPTV